MSKRPHKTACLRKRTLLFLVLLSCFLLPCVSALAVEDDEESLAGTPPEKYDASLNGTDTLGKQVVLRNGDTYDVSAAEKNTAVVINAPGTYRLKGKSNYCHVEINCGGVDLYLMDGLNIDPNINANLGGSTAAITVAENGGKVRIISEKNASIYLGGYYYCPAIRKEGLKTELIFETEDPSAPGTITCYRSLLSEAPGIGNAPKKLNVGDCVGNIEFKSGNIIATAGYNAAGIGSAVCGGGTAYLTFSGANVTAKGNSAGAGIGGGFNGNAQGIVISGGTVNASSTGEGAGIGGGGTDSSLAGKVYTITVSGGTVNAASEHGSGIGTGTGGMAEHIIISGGTVNASSAHGTGIGGKGTNFHGKCDLIDITGGTVTARGGGEEGVGIGSDRAAGAGDNTVNISGGRVTATGGERGYSIGGGGRGAIQDTGHCYVNISGGTVTTDPVITGRIGSHWDTTCTITGGSVRCGEIEGSVTDGKGNRVILTNVNLHDCPAGVQVTAADISSPASGYGLNDVVTLGGLKSSADNYSIVYPWLPRDTVTSSMTAGNMRFYGNAQTNQGIGDLYRATAITLSANASGNGVSDGTAWAVKGEASARDVTNAVRPGYTLLGYAPMRSSLKTVLNTDRSFGANVVNCTNENGEWLMTDTATTFYALWEGKPFNVYFLPLSPSGASTEISGNMDGRTYYPDDPQPLPENAFTLTGYRFDSWNTSPDNNGVSVSDGGSSSALNGLGTDVDLYSQWKPITYTVTFDGNGAAPTMPKQTLTFDDREPLTLNSLVLLGEAFTGWNTEPDGSGTAYSDHEWVVNLASEQDANITLYAQWAYTYYTVEYRPNGANGTPVKRTQAPGVQGFFADTLFTRDGYTFIGWSTKPDGGTLHRPYESFTDLAPAGKNIVLYARWIKNTPPKTGDANTPLLWAALALAAGCGLALEERKRCAR